jgi:membrane-associated phospholipid phosphatase
MLGLIGAFSFFLLGDAILNNPNPRLDRMAADLADRLHNETLVDIARVVTDIGSSPVTAVLTLATAVFAIVKRRWLDAGALFVGWVLVFAAVHIAKTAYDRERPADAFTDTFNAAYPSGHMAYAISLIAVATVLVRAGVGWAGRIALVTVAVILAVIVGITRIYLRAHFLTDVLGGAALAIAIWAVVGTFALFARRVRNNVPSETT